MKEVTQWEAATSTTEAVHGNADWQCTEALAIKTLHHKFIIRAVILLWSAHFPLVLNCPIHMFSTLLFRNVRKLNWHVSWTWKTEAHASRINEMQQQNVTYLWISLCWRIRYSRSEIWAWSHVHRLATPALSCAHFHAARFALEIKR
jgi:hypothetical protein